VFDGVINLIVVLKNDYSTRDMGESCRGLIQCVREVVVHLDLWGAAKSAVYRDRSHTLNELNTTTIAFIRNRSAENVCE
jgi:hypothetical protein